MRRSLALALILALSAAPAWGQRQDAASVEAQAGARARERDALRLDARAAAVEVERLRARLIVLARSQAADERTALAQRARFQALSQREQVLAAKMNRERGRQGRLLGALQTFSRHPPPALLVSPRSANDAVRAAILMKAVAPELQRRAAGLQRELDVVARVRRDQALAGEVLFLTESELAEQRAETERLIIEKTALERRLSAGAETASREVAELARRAASLRGLVGGLSERAAVPSTVPPSSLAAPVKGDLLRRFGQILGSNRSEGMAWRTGPSAQVLAPAAGAIEYAGPLKGWGGVVILRLDGGYRVVLAGLDRVAGLTGRRVAAGEPVGRMAPDRIGNRAGPRELYLEVRRDGAPVDPSPWLDAGR
jgi:septal ring factor EnvC (AmiA/AmiB activator)